MQAQYEAENLATIGTEMRKLIEVADILGELQILHKVLAEQSSTVLKYNGHVPDIPRPKEDCYSDASASTTLVSTEAPTSHMARITAMQKHAEDAREMVSCKSKHRDFQEETSGRRMFNNGDCSCFESWTGSKSTTVTEKPSRQAGKLMPRLSRPRRWRSRAAQFCSSPSLPLSL